MANKMKIVEWLSWHEDLWRALPVWEHEIKRDHSDRCRFIVELLKDAGLVSQTTRWKDVNIPRYVTRARARRSTRVKTSL